VGKYAISGVQRDGIIRLTLRCLFVSVWTIGDSILIYVDDGKNNVS